MGKIDFDENELVHTRKISVDVYSAGDMEIVVRGELKDDRHISIYDMFGVKIPSGNVHNIFLTIKVTQPGFVISDLEVEMVGIPKEGCVEAEKCLDWLRGEKIEAGFTNLVKRNTVNGKGCDHLTSLLLAMAPMAIQGFYTNVSSKKRDRKDVLYVIKGFLKNRCLVWREDGRYFKETVDKLSE